MFLLAKSVTAEKQGTKVKRQQLFYKPCTKSIAKLSPALENVSKGE